MTAPADREFEILPRGHIRDRVILANFRNGLRSLVNPETGALFTEDEIQLATQTKGRWWLEAESIDLFAMGEQRGALYLSDQVRIDRANTNFLENFHAPLWAPEGKLSATGGSGTVNVPAVPGTIILGSSTIGAPGVYVARDGAGKKYQVFLTTVTPGTGVAKVTMVAVDTGADTNLEEGTKLTWVLRDPNMQVEATVDEDFTGGTDKETDADFAKRMLSAVRHKQSAGNDAHIRAWLRSASNAIEEGFIYPCARHAGSVLCAITQKRGKVKGPLARVPSPGTMAAAIAFVTPPNSPVFPTPPFVLVVPINPSSVDLSLRLALSRGTAAGFSDATPFPSYDITTPAIASITSQTNFTIYCPSDPTLPGEAALATLTGADAPKIMVWHESESEFETLSVSSIEDLGSNTYRVLLSAPPATAIVVGDIISPNIQRHAVISATVGAYFDELGPGDLFNVQTDPRGSRCIRFPRTSEEWSYKAGAVVASRVMEALSGSAADGVLEFMSPTSPAYPTSILNGPGLLVAGKVGIYL